MTFLLLILLLQGPSSAPKTKIDARAVYVEAPVPHWSCPAGWEVPPREIEKPISPARQISCQHISQAEKQTAGGYENTQEMIYWQWTRTVGADGSLTIVFPAGFVRQPGCTIRPDEPMKVSDVTMKGFTIRAKPGLALTLMCQGLVNR